MVLSGLIAHPGKQETATPLQQEPNEGAAQAVAAEFRLTVPVTCLRVQGLIVSYLHPRATGSCCIEPGEFFLYVILLP